MTYPTYPEYKDSGVEWLGKIPKSWNKIALKYLLSEPLIYGANESADRDNPNDPRYIRITDIKSDGTLNDDTFRSLPIEIARPYLLKNNSLLLARSGATVGKTFLYDESWGEACFAGYLIKASISQTKAISKFVSYFTNSENYWQWVKGSQIQATIENVSAEKYASLYVPVPEISDQKQIAAFLDRETQKIDRLIEKQQQLIKLLQEKRQALISHAVTKGLNPDVKMKDSGVEWLGEIPEHWEVKRLKFVCSLVTKKVPTDNLKVIALENIEGQTGKYIQTESIYSGEDVGFVGGDILFGKLRPYLAKVYKADDCGVAFGDLLVYRPVDKVISDYAFYQMISDRFISTVDSSTYGSKMPRASVEFINDMPFLVPPLKEQKSISEFLEEKINIFEKLTEMANRAISISKERRTALISAAVTGKIDVRGAVNG